MSLGEEIIQYRRGKAIAGIQRTYYDLLNAFCLFLDHHCSFVSINILSDHVLTFIHNSSTFRYQNH